jgi:hypothetical protein
MWGGSLHAGKRKDAVRTASFLFGSVVSRTSEVAAVIIAIRPPSTVRVCPARRSRPGFTTVAFPNTSRPWPGTTRTGGLNKSPPPTTSSMRTTTRTTRTLSRRRIIMRLSTHCLNYRGPHSQFERDQIYPQPYPYIQTAVTVQTAVMVPVDDRIGEQAFMRWRWASSLPRRSWEAMLKAFCADPRMPRARKRVPANRTLKTLALSRYCCPTTLTTNGPMPCNCTTVAPLTRPKCAMHAGATR